MLSREQDLTNYIELNKDKIYRIAYSYMKNEDLALDTIQDAIEKSLKRIDTLREDRYIKTWFYRVLINQCLTNLKKHKITETTNIDDYDTKDLTDIEQSISIYECIDSLKPKFKTVILLRFFEDMKFDEIAEITGTNINTVKSRLYKALQNLKIKMNGF